MTAEQVHHRRVALVLMTLTVASVGALWWVVAPWDRDSGGSLVLFAFAAAIAELLPFEKARGRAVPMSIAVIGAFVLLRHSPAELALIAAVGWCFVATLHWVTGKQIRWAEGVGRVAGAWALGGVAALGHAISDVPVPSLDLELVPTLAVVATIILGLPLWEAVESTAKAGVPVRPVFLGLLESGWGGTVALSASAILGALVHPYLGAATVPMIVLPLLAARVGLSKNAVVRRSYDETVRAMSRLPEELGAVPRGHGVRVGVLATQVAREFGLPQGEVESIERAAHLHEVGRVRIEERDPSGRELALAGASVVREAGSLDDVADLIAHHRDPYRRPQHGDDPAVATGARIVRTVCDYDLVVSSGASPWDAIESVNARMAYDHDPEVIQALTRVLTRRGLL